MKIVWAIPYFENPKTGGEKIYAELKRCFSEKAEILHPGRLELFSLKNIAGDIKDNFVNLASLAKLDKDAWIFQDLSYGRKFVLANLILNLICRRKIVIFVFEEFVILDKLSLKGKVAAKILYRLLFWSALKIVTLSKAMERWISEFGDFAGKTYVFYPVIKKSSKSVKRENSGVNTLLCAANIRKNKGQEYLIEALKILGKKDIKLSLAGLVKDENYYACLREMVKRYGLTSQVEFHGFLNTEELACLYGSADIFILPTLKEAFGMVIVEAMSFGLPVIASNVGGIPELIEDRFNGLLIPPASPEKIAEAIEKVIADETLRKHLGANALKKYHQMPPWDKNVNALRDFLFIR